MKSRPNASGSTPEPALATAVRQCGADAVAMERLRAIYDQVDRRVAAAGAFCLGGGACCRFDLQDHRLFLTGLELAFLTSRPPPDASRAARQRCPYQAGPSCGAYLRRPLGCRTYFCRAALPGLCEEFHGAIRAVHESRCIPYLYGELCRMLLQFHAFEKVR